MMASPERHSREPGLPESMFAGATGCIPEAVHAAGRPDVCRDPARRFSGSSLKEHVQVLVAKTRLDRLVPPFFGAASGGPCAASDHTGSGLAAPGRRGGGIQPAPVPELKPAEGTVVEGKSEHSKHRPQRIGTHAVDRVRAPHNCQLRGLTDRTMAIKPERGEEGPVVIPSRAAVVASKGCMPEDFPEGVARTA